MNAIRGANFYNAVDQIKTRLGKNAICLQLPIGKEDEFKGIIDLFEMQAYIYNDEKGEDISITDIPSLNRHPVRRFSLRVLYDKVLLLPSYLPEYL